jgi:putative transposase
MPICYKMYRFRMRPTKAQESLLNRTAGARRWVWNWGLRRWKDHYEATGESLGYSRLSAEFTVLRRSPETAWLKDLHAHSMRPALKDLERAFSNYFARRARYPRFKSRKRDPLRFRSTEGVNVAGGKVRVPKIGWVRIRQSMPVDLPTKGAAFKRDATGKWFVTLVATFEMPDVPLPPPDPAKVVGIDLGLKDFAVTSDGERVAAPKFFRKTQRKLRKAQRALSRRKPGSKRRAKAKARVARIHQNITDRRGDFLHKLSTGLVNSHDGICIEDLSVKGLARTKLAKSFTDASMGEFRRQLEYKALWNRKHLVVIDRWFPSSKLCSRCGVVNDALTLADRHWVCACGVAHDRDLNAAINIRDEGLRHLAVGHTREAKRAGSPCQTGGRRTANPAVSDR